MARTDAQFYVKTQEEELKGRSAWRRSFSSSYLEECDDLERFAEAHFFAQESAAHEWRRLDTELSQMRGIEVAAAACVGACVVGACVGSIVVMPCSSRRTFNVDGPWMMWKNAPFFVKPQHIG